MKTYNSKKDMIKSFLENTKNRDDEFLFGELCFCILTPQSRASAARQTINNLKKDGKLFTATKEELQKYLVNIRFPEKKVEYLLKARDIFPKIKERLNTDPLEFREWLRKNVAGLGLKESSHFLRNIGIGFGVLTIMDIHVQNFMKNIGLHNFDTNKFSNKNYLELEKKFLELAKKINIPAEELDIAIWLHQSKESEFYG